MWYGLVEPITGDLVSVGTEAMFPGGNIDAFAGVYDRHDFGEVAPDFTGKLWSPVTRSIVNRPPPLLISRLDDIEAWLAADPDWSTAWSALNAARRNQIRNGLRRVLAVILGDHQWRGEEQTVEL